MHLPITLTIIAFAAEYPSSRWLSTLLSGPPQANKSKS